ncbi:MAG: ABC transporter ATP-binding protein [Ilumatobacter sp.]|nr:ABC transporter ATP-binding protein [Ilumatobacter sp.]
MTATSGTAGARNGAPAVELRDITKRFGAVVACDGVDLTLRRGTIHGILGENGAGKSTLMKILIGLVLPDRGSIDVDGRRVDIHDPQAAAALGIGMVHQHFSLVDALTVWENVALGEVGALDPDGVRARVEEIGRHYGLAIDPDARVGELTAGLRQRVEIIKCLRRDPGIVIFDEPTSVLTPDESEQLFTSFRDVVAAEGRAVVLVSHKLDEVIAATDEVTIMRQGRVVDRVATASTDVATLARGMVGRDVSLRGERAALGLVEVPGDDDDAELAETGEVPDAGAALELRDVCAVGPRGVPMLTDVSLRVAPGEIVGVAGVEGNGQRPLGDLLSSLLPIRSGTVLVDGRPVSTRRPGAMAEARIAVIPEDRHDSGVVLDMTVAENLVMVRPGDVARRGVLRIDELHERARRLIEQYDIQCAGPDAPMWTLSGGNQQRVVLARELSLSPTVLVAAQPTRGLDVGAIEYMTEQLRVAAAGGVGVLLISSELEEILDLSHRLVVMSRGSIVGEMSSHGVDLDRLGLMMGGSAA